MKQQTHTLKLATQKDIPEVVDLLHRLFNSSVYQSQTQFKRLDVIDNLERLLQRPADGLVLCLMYEENTVGVLVASHMRHLFNEKEKTAVELGFYIKEEHKTLASMKLMLQAYRYWARLQKCTSIMMGKMKDSTSIETYSLRRL